VELLRLPGGSFAWTAVAVAVAAAVADAVAASAVAAPTAGAVLSRPPSLFTLSKISNTLDTS